MIDIYVKTDLGAFETYLRHNTESPLVTKSRLMFYSLFYALSYSRNIPDINNTLTSVFYSSGYNRKNKPLEEKPEWRIRYNK